MFYFFILLYFFAFFKQEYVQNAIKFRQHRCLVLLYVQYVVISVIFPLPFHVHWQYTSAKECCHHYQVH